MTKKIVCFFDALIFAILFFAIATQAVGGFDFVEKSGITHIFFIDAAIFVFCFLSGLGASLKCFFVLTKLAEQLKKRG